ncbi:MAG: CopG family transcriptional regulator [Oscillospiraceae bacterium]
MPKNKLTITAKPPKGEDGYRTFSIRIREETKARPEELSAKSGRTRNELIGTLLEFTLDNCEIAEK